MLEIKKAYSPLRSNSLRCLLVQELQKGKGSVIRYKSGLQVFFSFNQLFSQNILIYILICCINWFIILSGNDDW